MEKPSGEEKNKIQATLKLLVTALIWASTYVLARMGVEEMGPITLAGLRFFTAGLILLIYLKSQHFDFSSLKGQWGNLLALGLLSFTVGNGAIFVASQYLPSTTVSLSMSFVTPLVLICGIIWLREIPSLFQFFGILIALAGTYLYFYPQPIQVGNPGFLVLFFGLFGFAGYTILGRSMARDHKVPYLAQTAVPLFLGGVVLLLAGLLLEGMPVFSPRVGLILIWLIAINSILGYILYNQAIICLTAIQVNVILNLSPFFTAVMAWFLLGEHISGRQIIAMLIVFAGTYMVQARPLPTESKKQTAM